MKLFVLKKNERQTDEFLLVSARRFKTVSAQNTYDRYGQRLGREHGLLNTVKALNYHNGHNFQTVTIACTYGEPTHLRVSPEIERKIVRHYRTAKKNGWSPHSPGRVKCETTKYLFIESYWQGDWELATVTEK